MGSSLFENTMASKIRLGSIASFVAFAMLFYAIFFSGGMVNISIFLLIFLLVIIISS